MTPSPPSEKSAPGRTAILTYHSLDPSGSVVSVHPNRFAEHVETLLECGIRGASLAELVAHRRRDGEWPARTVALTFDDGFANLHEHALPLLQRHGFAATVFLVSGHVGGFNDWEAPPEALGNQPMLAWEQIDELLQAGWEVGAHTRTHPDLRSLAGERLADEVVGCRDDLAERIGVRPESFAYPYGHTSPDVTRLVAQAFTSACTTELRWVGEEPFDSLPRIDSYYLQSGGRLRALLSGRLDKYLLMRRWGRSLRGALAG